MARAAVQFLNALHCCKRDAGFFMNMRLYIVCANSNNMQFVGILDQSRCTRTENRRKLAFKSSKEDEMTTAPPNAEQAPAVSCLYTPEVTDLRRKKRNVLQIEG